MGDLAAGGPCMCLVGQVAVTPHCGTSCADGAAGQGMCRAHHAEQRWKRLLTQRLRKWKTPGKERQMERERACVPMHVCAQVGAYQDLRWERNSNNSLIS